MPDHKIPGVFVQERSLSEPGIELVPTSIPLFIGYTLNADPGFEGKAIKVTSLLEYKLIFGWPLKMSEHTIFELNIELFYRNGGGVAYITSIGKKNKIAVKDHFSLAIKKINKNLEAALLVIPEIAADLGQDDCYTIQREMLEHCAKSKCRFAILDIFNGDKGIEEGKGIQKFRSAIGDLHLSWGAAYYPWVEVVKTNIPCSGAIAGVYAKVDRSRGVWKAPANVALVGINNLSSTVTDIEQEDLNRPADGKSICAIRNFPSRGLLIWGARTLDGKSNDHKFVSVKRFLIFLENSIRKGLQSFRFKPNDNNTWTQIDQSVSNLLHILWRDGALIGATPEQAFFVKIGLGKTMTNIDVEENRMILELGVAVVRPAEFIILKLVINIA